eukprot:gene4338-112_t
MVQDLITFMPSHLHLFINDTLVDRVPLSTDPKIGVPAFTLADGSTSPKPDLETIQQMRLRPGRNKAVVLSRGNSSECEVCKSQSAGAVEVGPPPQQGKGLDQASGSVWLWHINNSVVVSDIDGTITKGDLGGFVLPNVTKATTYTQPGVEEMFSKLSGNKYNMLYLSNRYTDIDVDTHFPFTPSTRLAFPPHTISPTSPNSSPRSGQSPPKKPSSKQFSVSSLRAAKDAANPPASPKLPEVTIDLDDGEISTSSCSTPEPPSPPPSPSFTFSPMLPPSPGFRPLDLTSSAPSHLSHKPLNPLCRNAPSAECVSTDIDASSKSLDATPALAKQAALQDSIPSMRSWRRALTTEVQSASPDSSGSLDSTPALLRPTQSWRSPVDIPCAPLRSAHSLGAPCAQKSEASMEPLPLSMSAHVPASPPLVSPGTLAPASFSGTTGEPTASPLLTKCLDGSRKSRACHQKDHQGDAEDTKLHAGMGRHSPGRRSWLDLSKARAEARALQSSPPLSQKVDDLVQPDQACLSNVLEDSGADPLPVTCTKNAFAVASDNSPVSLPEEVDTAITSGVASAGCCLNQRWRSSQRSSHVRQPSDVSLGKSSSYSDLCYPTVGDRDTSPSVSPSMSPCSGTLLASDGPGVMLRKVPSVCDVSYPSPDTTDLVPFLGKELPLVTAERSLSSDEFAPPNT